MSFDYFSIRRMTYFLEKLKDIFDTKANASEVPSVIDNLTSTSTTDALSAKQGKVLKDSLDGLDIPSLLSDLSDVELTSLANGQIIKYNGTSQKWINSDFVNGHNTYFGISEPSVNTGSDNDIYIKVSNSDFGKSFRIYTTDTGGETANITVSTIIEGIVTTSETIYFRQPYRTYSDFTINYYSGNWHVAITSNNVMDHAQGEDIHWSYNTTKDMTLTINPPVVYGIYIKTRGTWLKISNDSIDVVDNLTTQDATKALSAKQGYVLDQGKVDKVSGKGLSTEDYTTAEKTKLAGIASGAEVNVQSDWNQTTDTADDYIKNKPTLGTASAKDVPTSGNASTTQVVMGDDTRLTDARNAADVYSWAKESTKPTYTASEVGAIATTAKGTVNGVAELDSTGKVPSAQLPSYVDDVVEGYYYNSKFYEESTHETEILGESGKIYVDLPNDTTYRWSGTAFTQIKGDLVLGETSTTAYRGDRGKTAYDHSQTTSGNPHNVTKSDVGLSNVGNFKAVSTEASQGLTDTEKSNARTNIGAGTSSFSGSYNDLTNKPTLGTASAKDVAESGNASATQVVMGNDTRLTDSRTPTSHTHGNIQNAGTLQTNDVTIANGDKLVITDSSDSAKIARASVSFDGSTTSKALTPKGTFENFATSNTTYTFENGTNGFTVTPSGGSAQIVTVTPSITNNVTGSGTSGYLAKFNGENTITNCVALGSDTTKFLRNDGTWAEPSGGSSLPIDISSSSNVTGVLNVANGGTGNDSGYVRAGQKANTTIGTRATAEGYNTTASGNYSHAEGTGTTASFLAGHAEGTTTSASGNSSHAEGYGVGSSGTASHAEGNYTSASADYAHAEGDSTKAQKTASHAEGFYTTADGNYSHAEGYFATTSGYYAHAEGYFTTAKGSCSHVQGKYNIQDNNNTYAHIVGNGNTDNTRSNAHTLDWSGNAWFAGTVTDGTGNVLSNKQDKLPTVVNDRYLHTNANTGALEWAEGGSGGLYPRIIVSVDTGSTVVITDGVVTITATETSTGIYSADIPDYGVYTVTATKESRSATANVNVNTVSEYNISLSYLPNGSTVTPTDDIQTWLKCACIEDKNYTTLAEVLADSVTFNTLLADSNACDYMARSTTWAGGKLVPAMTSNTTPSGVVSAKSENVAGNAYKAFDNNDSTYWNSAGLSSTSEGSWIQYDFGSEVSIYKAAIKPYSVGAWKKYYIAGSNDGTNFTQVTEELTVTSTDLQYITFNESKYRYWRFVNTLIEGSLSTVSPTLYAAQLYGGIAGSASAMQLLGKYDYACSKLLSNSTWANAICNSEYFEYVLNTTVPNMTSDTAPSGECISGPYDGGRNPYNVFAGTNTGSFYSMTSTNNNYIGYHFPSPVKVVAFFIHYRQINASPMPKMTLQGSNDGTNWVSVGSSIQLSTSDQGSALTDTPSPDHIVSSNDNNAYSYWRLLFTDTSSGNSSFFRIQFYGRESLVDSYIPLVPILSSYNAPDGGVVSADSEYSSGYAAWRAFAVDGLTGESSTHGWLPSGGTTNQGIVYDFGRSVNVNKWAIASSYGTAGTTTTFIFSGSNDNVNYTQLDSQNVTCYSGLSTAQEYSIANTNSYRYYKVTISGTTDTNNIGIRLQFYGKLDKTIVHSAPYDTVYYKNNGSNIPLCTTNGDGIGEFDISSLGSGTYTLYSSVAKDPDSLSNDYSKTIRTSESEYGHTTEMYVMPDINVLYWYGYETPYAEDVVSANGWSWSGVTLSSPTHNSNYITLTSACYGSKNAITGTEKAVVEGVTAVSNVYGMIAAQPSKAISGQDWTEYSTSAKQVLSKSVSNKYVFVGSVNGRSSKLYAYWYE